jgi:hypothetical protein
MIGEVITMSVIGKMTKSRGTWAIKPVTKVKESKKNRYDRKKRKKDTKRRIDEYV